MVIHLLCFQYQQTSLQPSCWRKLTKNKQKKGWEAALRIYVQQWQAWATATLALNFSQTHRWRQHKPVLRPQPAGRHWASGLPSTFSAVGEHNCAELFAGSLRARGRLHTAEGQCHATQCVHCFSEKLRAHSWSRANITVLVCRMWKLLTRTQKAEHKAHTEWK